MSRQKSIGEIAFQNVGKLVYNMNGYAALLGIQRDNWEAYADKVIAEHERRKRAKVKTIDPCWDGQTFTQEQMKRAKRKDKK